MINLSCATPIQVLPQDRVLGYVLVATYVRHSSRRETMHFAIVLSIPTLPRSRRVARRDYHHVKNYETYLHKPCQTFNWPFSQEFPEIMSGDAWSTNFLSCFLIVQRYCAGHNVRKWHRAEHNGVPD